MTRFRNYTLIVVIFFLLYILQITILTEISYGAITLNIFFLFTIYINWKHPTYVSFITSIAIGLFTHPISPLPLYGDIMIYSVVGLFVQYLSLNTLTNLSLPSLYIAGLFGISLFDGILLLFAYQNYLGIFSSWNNSVHIPTLLFLQITIAALFLLTAYTLERRYEMKQKPLSL